MKLYIGHLTVSGVKTIRYYSINTTKVSLNSYENKRYWTTSVDSLAYGHFKINEGLKTINDSKGINNNSIVIVI